MTKINPTDPMYQVDPNFPPDKESTWPYPPEKDGWVKAHNSLRGELAEIKSALEAIVSRGQGLKEWELRAFKEAFDAHLEHIHAHHSNEDDYFMPEMRKRFKCPEKLDADHKDIEKAYDTLSNLVANLKVGSQVDELTKEWMAYETLMCPHLKEEEETALMLMRAYYVPSEVSVLVQKIIKHGPKVEMGSFIHFMGVKEFREVFMKQEGIPCFVWYIDFQCKYKHFVKRFVHNVEALKTGTEPKKGRSFLWTTL